MTSGGYDPSKEYSPPYQNSYDHQSQSPRTSFVHPNDTENQIPTRSRADSTANSDGVNPSQPLHEAINTFKPSEAASQVDPQLLAHITEKITEQVTERVINDLRAKGVTGSSSVDSTVTPPIHPPSSPTSPTTAASIPRQYTPPSPGDKSETFGDRSGPPESMYTDVRSHDNPDASSGAYRRGSNVSPSRREEAGSRPQPARTPTAIPNRNTSQDFTDLENRWQLLFDDSGQPTARASQVLRGIAVHVIEQYEPQNSLVVTPDKMFHLFRTAIPTSGEVYPLVEIFSKCSYTSMSRIYRELGCQHHLVQGKLHEEPKIPGLTPEGFKCWMTLLIQAHPDKEYERLSNIMLNLPINNGDDCTERLPKVLSRRLLPKGEDRCTQQRLYAAFSTDPNIRLPNSSMIPPPPSQPPPINNTFMERERNPYSVTPSASLSSSNTAGSLAVDDEYSQAARIPIERERKPYTAGEGTGKIFDAHSRERTGSWIDRESSTTGASTARISRSNSAAPQPSPYSKPMDIPPPNYQRGHRLSGTGSRPNFYNPNSRSEGANLTDIPQEYYGSNLYREPSDPSSREDFRGQGRRESVDPRYTTPLRSNHDYSSRDARDVYDDRRLRRTTANAGNVGAEGYASYPRDAPARTQSRQ